MVNQAVVMTDILHLTPHLGGGVGKALSTLCVQALESGSTMRHTVVCLERPEKGVFLERIESAGGRVHITPSDTKLSHLVGAADIVHLNWWNHPALFPPVCQGMLPAMRLLVWSHVSGLSSPFIPSRLLETAHRFVFTSACSLEAPGVSQARAVHPEKFAVVSSGCGLEQLPEPVFRPSATLRAGYLGSLNFGKLHPDYVDFLTEVDLPGFQVDLVGDNLTQAELTARCAARGRPDLLNFRGFRSDVATELARLDVLIYLLNPDHYGTAENALIEAMAMGVVPIVLNNPAETRIVEDGVTGVVVRSPRELSAAVTRLAEDPIWRLSLARQAAQSARSRFTAAAMELGLASLYREMTKLPKAVIDFVHLFGPTPADWFLSCQGDSSPFRADGRLDLEGRRPSNILLESSKGSVFHFRDHFPSDTRLNSWASQLEVAR